MGAGLEFTLSNTNAGPNGVSLGTVQNLNLGIAGYSLLSGENGVVSLSISLTFGAGFSFSQYDVVVNTFNTTNR